MILIRCNHSGPEWIWERWQWRGTPYSPKLQHCWNLTIRLFSVISRKLVGVGGLTHLQRSIRCILQLQPTGQNMFLIRIWKIFFKCISDAVSCQHEIKSNSQLGKNASFEWWGEGIRNQMGAAGRGCGINIEIQIRRKLILLIASPSSTPQWEEQNYTILREFSGRQPKASN